MALNWYFFYQQRGKEDTWQMALGSERQSIIESKRPAFATALDLSSVPDDNDWTKVRYQGAYYVDFDADGDLELACTQFQAFLGKLDAELEFDLTQARFFASGSKGFHVEIPEACFMPKPPPGGTAWLPYIYREMSQALFVDTLDLAVYTGKKGRQWRVPNVQRENGMYKVPLTLGEALSVDPDLYAELIKEPREVPAPTPAFCNSKFAMLFDRAKTKMVSHMRGKKKRQEKAAGFLEPWRKAGQTPPSIETLMRGEQIAEGAGFQSIAMQLAIYATSVSMPLAEFLERCQGLCENHVSDSRRYNNPGKRRAELTRMFEYMGENSLYDFEVGPIVRLLQPGTSVADLGVMDTYDREDDPTPGTPAIAESDPDDGDPTTTAPKVVVDLHHSVRRGFLMNSDGMFRRSGENIDSVCRASMRNVEALFSAEGGEFKGYEFDILVNGKKVRRSSLSADAFTTPQKMKQFMSSHQLSYQGGELETGALLDVMAEKAGRGGKVFVYPREGLFLLRNPTVEDGDLVTCFLTQDYFASSLEEDDPNYFRLRYKPATAISSYNIDIHQAPKLDATMLPALHDLFAFNRDTVLADTIGWFVAAHYRALYLHFFGQFPLLHLWGEAGSGKSKTVELLARLHWYDKTKISLKSAASSTLFALDVDASSSTSAPMIVDEWKPKELKMMKGRYEKLKDVLKASYIGADIGNRGTLNKGAESTLGVIRSKATAPIVFMAEAIESETAIFERSVVVPLSQNLHAEAPSRTEAFNRLYEGDSPALSALGRAIVEWGFSVNFDSFRDEVQKIRNDIKAGMPDLKDQRRLAAPRLIFNRAVVTHALTVLKRILHEEFGPEFDSTVDRLIGSRAESLTGEEGLIAQMQGMSEISKTLSRMALLSRARDEAYEMKPGQDYVIGDGWLEIKAEAAYDKYRRYCASINDTPLFDTVDALVFALTTYSATVDKFCTSSELREDGSTERIFRLDLTRLRAESVQAFRQP